MDVITLSSDEDDDTYEPKAKKLKLGAQNHADNCIVIDDTDDVMIPPIISTTKDEKLEDNLSENQKESVYSKFVIEKVESLHPETAKSDDGCVVIDDDDDGSSTASDLTVLCTTPHIPSSNDKSSGEVVINGQKIGKKHIKPILLEAREKVATAPQLADTDQPNTRASLAEFLDVCSHSVEQSQFESRLKQKYSMMLTRFEECSSLHHDLAFKKMIEEKITEARKSPACAVTSFKDVFDYILDNICPEVEVTAAEKAKLIKLERAMKKLMKKLKRMDGIVVLDENDEDSAYMQTDRYVKRLVKIHDKYCEILDRDPYSGRITHEKIVFVHSKFNEINVAISRTFKNQTFPSYSDVEKCIKKTVTNSALKLTANEIKSESQYCFKKIGDMLQLRRKKELYMFHSEFIKNTEDPAKSDHDLNLKLKRSAREGQERMASVVEKFVRQQENNPSTSNNNSHDSQTEDSSSDAEGNI